MNHESRITNSSAYFLQSEYWLRFQESVGREVVRITDGGFSVCGIVHVLPVAGRYLYTPRVPTASISNFQFSISKLLAEARRIECGWVRVEPETEDALAVMRKNVETLRRTQGDNILIVRAPHDMQSKETFVIDITKSEVELLARMKPKTRYNVRLAGKRGVHVFQTTDKKYQAAFVDLVSRTADRKGIVSHPRTYYEKMLSTLLGDTATLFVAEHEGDILGVNLIIFYGDTATYLHGGSADTKREYMAPFLLQWEAIREAKRRGCIWYDFGGVRTRLKIPVRMSGGESRKFPADPWSGITRFKIGFSPETEPTRFPGCYDIILSPTRYAVYRFFSFSVSFVAHARKTIRV